MFSILIVDDEDLSLKSIRRMVDWQALGIDSIFEASDGFKAQAILMNNRVNLMICDIEMPQMDGLALVEWLRENQMETEVVILTCHDSFDLAQKALRLGSVEYILKPVLPEDLAKAVRHALGIWKEKDNQRGVRQLWDKSVSFRRVQYFDEILRKSIPSTPNSLRNYSEIYGLPFDENERIYIALVYVESMGISEKEAQEFMYSLQNVAMEMWNAMPLKWGCLNRLMENAFLLLGAEEGEEAFENDFGQRFENFAAEHLVDVCVYTSAPGSICEVCAQVDKLRLIHERKQFCSLSVLKRDAQAKERILRDTEARWRGYVENQRFNLIYDEIADTVKNYSGQSAQNADDVQRMKEILLKVVKKSLPEKAEQLLCLVREDAAEEFASDVSHSGTQLLAWSEWVLQKLKEWLYGSQSPSDIMDQICKYIAFNIHNEISREDVAAAVHMNPDYVSRLFKKEMGMSLNSYMVNKRISLAKQLLAYTDIPVGDISGSLGYSSFSHFTKIFRSSEGVTPSEYRKLFKKGG